MAENHHKICFFLIFSSFIQNLDALRIVCWELGNNSRLIFLKNERDACADCVAFVLKAVCTLSYRKLLHQKKKVTFICSFDSGFFSGKKLAATWISLHKQQLYFPSQPIKVFSFIHSFRSYVLGKFKMMRDAKLCFLSLGWFSSSNCHLMRITLLHRFAF